MPWIKVQTTKVSWNFWLLKLSIICFDANNNIDVLLIWQYTKIQHIQLFGVVCWSVVDLRLLLILLFGYEVFFHKNVISKSQNNDYIFWFVVKKSLSQPLDKKLEIVYHLYQTHKKTCILTYEWEREPPTWVP